VEEEQEEGYRIVRQRVQMGRTIQVVEAAVELVIMAEAAEAADLPPSQDI
jgi:hypothetical protein